MAEIVSFRALLIANEQRSAYGLRYHDYTRYRKHCANRTHRLRSSLKMTHGKGREFKKLPVVKLESTKDGHLQLLLFEAERAWAYSQELIAESLKPSNEDTASTLRHHATGRFRRAINWSTQLLSHCQALYTSSPPRLSAENLLEVSIYTLILNGRFLKWRDDFENSLTQLGVARSLLDVLFDGAKSSRAQALMTVWSDEISTEIRHCAYELGKRDAASNIDGIVKEVAAKHRNEYVENCDALIAKYREEMKGESDLDKSKLEPLIWEDEPVPVRSPELVDVLLKVQQAKKKLEALSGSTGSKADKGVTAYDAILLALSDAEEVSRKLTEAQQSGLSSSSGGGGQPSRDIRFVHAYIVYQLLAHRIQRDTLLLSALISHQPNPNRASTSARDSQAEKAELARLYPAILRLLSGILQSLTQMRTLSVVDDSPDLSLSSGVEARMAFVKSKRCVYLARSYGLAKKYAEGLVLLQHAAIHIRETRAFIQESGGVSTSPSLSFYSLTEDDIKSLDADVTEDSFQLKRDWLSHNGGSIDKSAEDYKKPLFFNVAFNYLPLDMDKLRERAGKERLDTGPASKTAPSQQQQGSQAATRVVEEEVEEEQPEQVKTSQSKGGLSSLLGGWWGRS